MKLEARDREFLAREEPELKVVRARGSYDARSCSMRRRTSGSSHDTAPCTR
jgi:hypothetical protein